MSRKRFFYKIFSKLDVFKSLHCSFRLIVGFRFPQLVSFRLLVATEFGVNLRALLLDHSLHHARVWIEGQQTLLPSVNSFLAHYRAPQQILVDRMADKFEDVADRLLNIVDQVLVVNDKHGPIEVAAP